jgi:hypothetical protein
MPVSKERISSPLEAGLSLLDAKQLPPQLTSALDYVSKRLARKRLHLTLIVVRKDINIPGLPSPQSPKPPEPGPSLTTSPARSLFSSASSTFARSLTKHSIQPSISDSGSTASSSSRASLSRTTWPGLPSSPQDRRATPPLPQVAPSRSPSPPMSASSSSSSSSAPTSPATPKPNPFGES